MEDKEPEKPKSGFGFEKSFSDINKRIAWEEWSMRNRHDPTVVFGHKQAADAYRDLLNDKLDKLELAYIKFASLFKEFMHN